jgi:hypothetical protein
VVAELVRDARADLVEHVQRDAAELGGHAVEAVDGADGDRLAVGAHVALDADGLDGQQRGVVLPGPLHAVLLGGGLELLLDDGAGFARDLDAVGRDLAQRADGEAGPGEGLALGDGQLEVAGDLADLVLVEVVERFDDVEVELLGQAADVVVALDRVARVVAGLDPVGRDRSLDEVLGLEPFGLLLEDADELFADDLALLLGVRDAFQCLEEAIAGVHEVQLDPHVVEDLADLLGLVLPHEPGVDEDRGQVLGHGLASKHGGHRGVHATGAGDDRGTVDGLLDLLDLLLDEGLGVDHGCSRPGSPPGYKKVVARRPPGRA